MSCDPPHIPVYTLWGRGGRSERSHLEDHLESYSSLGLGDTVACALTYV